MDLSGALALYKGKKILITGHTGFKGAWLGTWLHSLGAKMMGIALAPTAEPSLYTTIGVKDWLHEEQIMDISHAQKLCSVIKEFKPEIIFHLAAQSLVRPSYQYPLETFNTNIMGTAHVLEACRSISARAVVIVTSDKCYANREWVWGYRENDPMGGHDPYSASKGCAELVTDSYISSFFSPEKYGRNHHTAIATARAGNVIGGGDWSLDRLIPDCVRALSQNETIRIRFPQAVRPWQHVLESLSGYLLLAANLYESGVDYGGGWNFAPLNRGDTWPVERITCEICSLWGHGNFTVENTGQPHEAHSLNLDASKACQKMGWQPKWSVARAIQECILWYKAHLNNPSTAHMREVTFEQIQKYSVISK